MSITLADFFHQIKVCQPKRRKDSFTSRLPKNEEIRWILYEAAKNFEVFSKFKVKIKNQKPIAVDVFS
jgi:hypothetical protein